MKIPCCQPRTRPHHIETVATVSFRSNHQKYVSTVNFVGAQYRVNPVLGRLHKYNFCRTGMPAANGNRIYGDIEVFREELAHPLVRSSLFFLSGNGNNESAVFCENNRFSSGADNNFDAVFHPVRGRTRTPLSTMSPDYLS